MSRKESKAVPIGNDPTPQNAYVVVRGVTSEEFRRVMSNVWDGIMDELTEDFKRTNHRLASLEMTLGSHVQP